MGGLLGYRGQGLRSTTGQHGVVGGGGGLGFREVNFRATWCCRGGVTISNHTTLFMKQGGGGGAGV